MSLHVSYNSFHIIAFIWQEYYLNIFTIRYIKGKISLRERISIFNISTCLKQFDVSNKIKFKLELIAQRVNKTGTQ